ncbi:hypothetical protein KR009_006930 [Drosophila setifemur]|nr:hypothetical protein KR009_006930 [Drosophila setifemur]
MNQLIFISWILFWAGVQAAFQDFVIGPESHVGDNEMEVSEQQEEDFLTSFHDVEHDGIVDANLLLKALMQHARRLGMSLDDLANLYMSDDDEIGHQGCSAGQEVYQERPSWRDVFFN